MTSQNTKQKDISRANLVKPAAILNVVQAAKDYAVYNSAAQHGIRVSKLATEIGRLLEFDSEHLDDLEFASVVHDIGTVGETLLLSQPSAYTEADWAKIKEHSQKSAMIVERLRRRSQRTLDRVHSYVLHHHEHFDGSGYPDGLSGKDIPLGCRIILVADAYDALRSPRAYRDPLSHQEAVEEMVAWSGRQFDPQILKVFLSIEKSVEARYAMVHNQYLKGQIHRVL